MFSQGLFVSLSKRSCYDFGISTLYRLWTARSEPVPPDTWVFLQSREMIPSLSQVGFHVTPLSIERHISSHGYYVWMLIRVTGAMGKTTLVRIPDASLPRLTNKFLR